MFFLWPHGYKDLTYLKMLQCWERVKVKGEVGSRWWDGYATSPTNGLESEQILGDREGKFVRLSFMGCDSIGNDLLTEEQQFVAFGDWHLHLFLATSFSIPPHPFHIPVMLHLTIIMLIFIHIDVFIVTHLFQHLSDFSTLHDSMVSYPFSSIQLSSTDTLYLTIARESCPSPAKVCERKQNFENNLWGLWILHYSQPSHCSFNSTFFSHTEVSARALFFSVSTVCAYAIFLPPLLFFCGAYEILF